MLLPLVTRTTREQVWQEVKEIEARGDCFAVVLMDRLSKEGGNENPLVFQFLLRLHDHFAGKPWLAKAVAYGCFVYRMLELESGGKLPVVTDAVAAQLQRDFFAHPKRFVRSIMKRIVKENFEIATANFDFVWLEALSDDPEEKDSAYWVCTIGAVVYRFIEGQIEDNRTTRLFQ